MKLLYLLFVLLVLQSQAKRDRKKDFLFSPDGVGGSAVGVVVGQGGAGVRKRVDQILAGERGELVDVPAGTAARLFSTSPCFLSQAERAPARPVEHASP